MKKSIQTVAIDLNDITKRADEQIHIAKRAMMVGEPTMKFFAHLLYRLEIIPSFMLPSAATDGVHLFYNPTFWLSKSPKEQIAILAHEVMHCASRHMLRIQLREMAKYNCACDMAINPLLADSGLKLPKDAIMPGLGEFTYIPHDSRWAAERYYDLIRDSSIKKIMQGPGKCGGAGGRGYQEGDIIVFDPSGLGGVLPYPNDNGLTDAERTQLDQEWRIATTAAAHEAFKRGTMPSDIARMIDEIKNPKVDWRDVLRNFITEFAKDDYSWTHPNRRWLAMTGDILPGQHSERLGHLLWTIDSSGSIDRPQLTEFASNVFAALELNPMKMTIMFHHTDVYNTVEWKPGDDPVDIFKLIKTGGTSHLDVFRRADLLEEAPVAMISLTDLMSEFPENPPSYPVLWATKDCYKKYSPGFGSVVVID